MGYKEIILEMGQISAGVPVIVSTVQNQTPFTDFTPSRTEAGNFPTTFTGSMTYRIAVADIVMKATAGLVYVASHAAVFAGNTIQINFRDYSGNLEDPAKFTSSTWYLIAKLYP